LWILKKLSIAYMYIETVSGIPQQIVLLIKNFYTNFSCRVGSSDYSLKVITGKAGLRDVSTPL